MKHYDSDEDLERALFALDLEEPPADMRASILAATIYREPMVAGARPWEVWLLGTVCAVLVAAIAAVARGAAGPAMETAGSYADTLLALFSQPATLFWIAVGGAATIWISQLNLTLSPGDVRATRR